MHAYFAYGCNTDPKHMATLCPGATPRGAAVLADHHLAFPLNCETWLGGVGGLEPTPGEAVHGVLWTIDSTHLVTLDEYEAVDEGDYTRQLVSVQHAGEPVQAWTYFAVPDPAGPYAPSRRYMQALIDGALAAGLPGSWVQHLRSVPTNGRI